MDTNIALINAGSFRSDSIEPPGKITQQTINSILPFKDKAYVVDYSGQELVQLFENSVSQYPLLDGRFLQISGVAFNFDPRLPAGRRINPNEVLCYESDNTRRKLDFSRKYRVAVKSFIHIGKDGYPEGSSSAVVKICDIAIGTMVTEYLEGFSSIAPQSEGRIVCMQPEERLLKSYKCGHH